MEEEEEAPLKIIELTDFLRLPSILSKKLQFKQIPTDQFTSSDQSNRNNHQSVPSKISNSQSGIVLLKQTSLSSDNQYELIVPKDIIVFADDADRKKIGLINKSTNLFSRHLLITSGAALQALIPSLTNAKEWIILSKLKYFKRFTKRLPIQENVVISLNVNHPLVRYELLTAFDLLQQSFNEVKSAYIVIDFRQILSRWFKNYLKRTDQYPNLSNRLFYRYQIQTNKCSITLGKRISVENNENYHHHMKSDVPLEIYIDFNSLPTIVYSIQLNNIFTYSMNDQYKQILKNLGDGLSLVSVQNINSMEDQTINSIVEQTIQPNKCLALVQKEKIIEEKPSIPQIEPCSSASFYQPTEQDKILFDKVSDNRMRIQMQHQQLMNRAAKLLSYSSINNESFNRKNNEILY